MKRFLRLAAVFLLGTCGAWAAPLVSGFERFHAATPSAEGGRLLYNELGCANCHGGDTGLPARRGPELNGVTLRARSEWLAGFIANPNAAHPGTPMPALLEGEPPDAAAAVVQYLATLNLKVAASPKGPPKTKSPRHVNASRGRELFHTVGCAACHAPQPQYTPPDGFPKTSDFTHASVGLPDLRQKTNLGALTAFLLDPLKLRPSGRMPKLLSNEDEALDVAGYLLDFQGSDSRLSPEIVAPSADAGAVSRGRVLVAQARCAACHELPKEVASEPVPLRSRSGGCLEAQPAKGVPRYVLSEAQRSALLLHLRAADERLSPARAADLTLQALQCVACHERDGLGGPDTARKSYFQGDHNLGDTGRYPPPLTAVGRKLQPEWLEKVLAGENRVRPYLKTRMPVYGGAVEGLGSLLAEADAKDSVALPGGDDTAGRKLLGTLGGIGCITCHRWGERPSLGIQALDLSNLGQRLQPGWLYEYLLDPAAYRPGTLMPSFWPGGKAAHTAVLGGDTAKQIASIYSFAKSANGEPEGFPQTQNGEFELVPKDRPIVQRTFMEGVGSHTILVGFPEGTHVAYDAKTARPVLAWQGRFFDAYNTWFSRFAPFEKPAGERVVRWPQAGDASRIRFMGYRLDAAGVPVFLSEVSGVAVEERFEGTRKSLRRSISWSGPDGSRPVVEHPEGVTVREESPGQPGRRIFNYLWE
jgi:mono/diheme cytochrome c family protein